MTVSKALFCFEKAEEYQSAPEKTSVPSVEGWVYRFWASIGDALFFSFFFMKPGRCSGRPGFIVLR